jgi:O-antigen ligase
MTTDVALGRSEPRLWHRLSITAIVFWDAVIIAAISVAGPVIGGAVVVLLGVAAYCLVSPIGLPLILSIISQIGTLGSITEETAHAVKWAISLLFLATAFIRHSTSADRWKAEFGQVDKVLLLFLLWGLVCTTVAVRPFDSLIELARMGMFFLVYTVTRVTISRPIHLTVLLAAMWIAVVSSSLYSCAGVLQQGFFRVTGFLSNANAYGLFLSFTLPVLGIGVVMHKKVSTKLIFAIGIGIGIPALLLTWSRTALLAVLVQLITFLVIEKRKKLLALLATLAVIGVVLAAMSPSVRTSFSTLMRLKAGATHRPVLWSAGIGAIAKNPVFGMGFNVQKQDVVSKVMWSDFANYELFSGIDTPFKPHNVFLYVAMSTGLPGLLIYLWLYRATFSKQYRSFLKSPGLRERRVHAIMLSLLVGTLFHGLFESASILAAGSNANYFWIALGMVTAISEKKLLGEPETSIDATRV